MKNRNQEIIELAGALVDVLLIYAAYLLAVLLRFEVMSGVVSIAMDSLSFKAVMLGYAVIVVLCYAACHLYHPYRVRRFGLRAGLVLAVNTVSVLVLMSVLFTFRLVDVSRGTLALFWGISSAFVLLRMLGFRLVRKAAQKKEQFLRHVIVIGNGRNAQAFVKAVASRPELGMKVDGYISRVKRDGLGENLGDYEDLPDILEKGSYDELVVALEPHEILFMPTILQAADKEGIRVEMIPMYNEYYPVHPTIESVGETKLVDLRATPLDNIFLAAVKRAADILISLVLLVLLSPLFLAIALGVRLSGPGPVLFRQERVGRDKKPFTMLKFRSMRSDIDHDGWSTNSDPRKTKFGSFIRKYSLDELPQLWNVLMGQMSLVGPRPELPVYVQQFKETVPLYLVRQQVRPGMTGWAQVNGLRGDTSIEDRVDYDIWYIQNWSLSLDLRILLKTAFGGMKNEEKLV